ncbi:MAG: MFS transporter [Bacteroidia bacterium]
MSNINVASLKGNKTVIRAWTMYDWSNSVYQLSITSAILPAYYGAVAKGDANSMVSFFGFQIVNTTLYAWAVSASFLIVALFSPLLASIADYTGRRKLFMQIFTWLGALSCASLYFFTPGNLELGIISFTLAGIGYSGGLVFYNAWLPEIAPAGMEDRISARGYALGYIGGVILLIFNLMMLLQPSWFGIEPGGMAARISFVTVGVWWLGFAQITFAYLPSRLRPKTGISHLVINGYRELKKVFDEFRKQRVLKLFIAGFFFTMMAVLTVMYMAANFGKKELGLEDEVLIPTILIIQLVGVLGSIGFARLSEKIGNIKALMLSIVIWIGICVMAYFVTDAAGFMVLAAVVGLVMGGVQALARSTYSKLLPSTNDHAAYYSFYDVAEKMSVVLGTFFFGLLEMLTGSMRASILLLGGLFIIGLIFFIGIRKEKVLLPIKN